MLASARWRRLVDLPALAAVSGIMLRGSIIQNYDYDYDGGLRRVFAADGRDQGPRESELNVVAMVLLGVAWLTLVLGCVEAVDRAVAALPGLLMLTLAGACRSPTLQPIRTTLFL
jgi:hypothetical protein